MNVLVFNGSPRGQNSKTMILTKSFIEGLNYFSENEIKIIDLSNKKIEHCLGCFSCWRKPHFSCVIDDDMHDISTLMVKADLIIWSFPLYHYSVPSKMKSLIDRTLPIDPLFGEIRNGSCYYGILSKKTKQVVISTCGNIKENSYASVDDMFGLSCNGNNFEHISLKGGETINNLECYKPLINYLDTVKNAGMEYCFFEKFSEDTRCVLSRPIFCDEIFDVKSWINED